MGAPVESLSRGRPVPHVPRARPLAAAGSVSVLFIAPNPGRHQRCVSGSERLLILMVTQRVFFRRCPYHPSSRHPSPSDRAWRPHVRSTIARDSSQRPARSEHPYSTKNTQFSPNSICLLWTNGMLMANNFTIDWRIDSGDVVFTLTRERVSRLERRIVESGEGCQPRSS